MKAPNLASQPFLNARPVWLVTIVALVLAAIFLGINVHVYLRGNRILGEQIQEQEQLLADRSTVEVALTREIDQLDRVPWRGLGRKVDELNFVLRQQGFSWLALLRDIEEVLPRDVRLVRIAPTVEEVEVALAIEGVARSRDAMLDLLENLIQDERFSNPMPSIEVSPEESGTGIYEFALEVHYKPEELAP